MKRIIIALALMVSVAGQMARAQLTPLPEDPQVRRGVLDNGMTYYIRHNDKPAQRAEFYLASAVGAIQETPEQDGLAHFLEHMCFNGTRNFPGKAIINYLESIGASFGGNVNASTGMETTQYMLNNIPLVREGVVDTCLLIMHDYSHFVTCDPAEIDAERGVILEEKRTRNTASWRIFEGNKPYLFGDTKYTGCSVIGSEDNLKTFRPETLVDFYHTWYRPDMQAVIVVGDVDVDAVESRIREIFADIPAPVNPRPREVIMIPDNPAPVAGIVTDPEYAGTSVMAVWRDMATPEILAGTREGFTLELIKDVVTHVMDERLEDIASRPDAPFLGAGFGFTSLCRTADLTLAQVQCREGEALTSFSALMTEVERMRRYGLSDAEVERAKSEILSQYETAANKASTRKNAEFVRPLINNFFDGTPYMDPADAYRIVGEILPQISSELLSQVCASLCGEHNLSVIYNAQDKDGISHPSEEELLAVVSSVGSASIADMSGEEVPSSFVDPASLKGSKVRKTAAAHFGATEWTLRNGVRVVLLPTDYEKDKVTLSLSKWGGMSLVEDADLPSFETNLWSTFVSSRGVSSYPAATVGKMLSGKQVRIRPATTDVMTSISGTSTRKDLETALQMMYLEFTDPRFDKDEYDRAVSSIEAVLPGLAGNPDFIFQKRVSSDVYGDDPRAVMISEECLRAASLQTMERVTREILYADAAGAVLFVVGDFSLEDVKPLVEKYIGSLPKGKKAPSWQDRGPYVTDAATVDDFAVQMLSPKVRVAQIFKLNEEYSTARSVAYSALEYILDMIYVATLREEEGGTYGARAHISSHRIPRPYTMMQIVFDTNEDKADDLRSLTVAGLAGIAESGPDAEQFDKAVSNLRKTLQERRITNGYWLGALRSWYFFGEDTVTAYEAALDALTPAAVQAAAADLLTEASVTEVVMRPEK